MRSRREKGLRLGTWEHGHVTVQFLRPGRSLEAYTPPVRFFADFLSLPDTTVAAAMVYPDGYCSGLLITEPELFSFKWLENHSFQLNNKVFGSIKDFYNGRRLEYCL